MEQYQKVATLDAAGVFALLHTEQHGLTQAEAAARLKQTGRNELRAHSVSALQIFLRQFRSPFLYLLLGAAALSFGLGELFDGLLILAFVLINSILGFLQEYRSEQTIHLLSQYLTHTCHVMRDGERMSVDATEIVPGDVLILEPGDRIPADIRFVDATNLAVDESVFTGESISVPKNTAALAETPAEAYAAANIGFSGTTVVSGDGMGIVFATGTTTAVGQIAKLTTETERVSSFQIGINKISRFILQLIGITLVFVVLANIFIHRGETNILELIIFSIALAVSVTPEALPVVMTFSFSRGAKKLAANHVVIKRLPAVEDLGSIEVLCTDKTGTLTENVLSVADVYGTDDRAALLTLGATAASSFGKSRETNNAFDLALLTELVPDVQQRLEDIERVETFAFDPVQRSNAVMVRGEKSGLRYILRGAPESILARTTASSAEQKKALAWVQEQGTLGRRALAIAYADGAANTKEQLISAPLTFAGMLTFVDPVKSTTTEAVAQAKALGVRVVILTGDSPGVAGAVGKEIGLTDDANAVMTGAEFAALPVAEKHRAAATISVFARTSPKDKFDIISILKEDKLVGFLGEGINDAPALKTAHVALAVDHASDIARDTADIVLLEKNLKVIVDGIREGRKIFANTTKYIRATLASNFGNFYAVAVSSLLIPFLPMLPIQLLLLNLLSDFPMISIATDTVDEVELTNPKSYDVKDIALSASVLGVVSSAFDFLVFAIFVGFGASILQTNWFIASVLTELVFLFSVRSRLFFLKATPPSPIITTLSLAAIGVTLVLPFLPFSADVFQFTTPKPEHLLMIFGIVLVYLVTTESVKLLYFRMTATKKASPVSATVR